MAGRKLLCGGGDDTEAHFPNPPPPSLAAVTGGGGSGRGCPTCRAGGGGGSTQRMAQNDTHVALIILTAQMWGGGNYWWKKLFRAKICVSAPSAPTSVLRQNKGPDTEPHFSNPPPSFGGRLCPSPPPRRAIFRSPIFVNCIRTHTAQHYARTGEPPGPSRLRSRRRLFE